MIANVFNAAAPTLRELVAAVLGGLPGRGGVDRFGHRVPAAAGGVAKGVADQVQVAGPHHRLRPHVTVLAILTSRWACSGANGCTNTSG
ncbi:hypothetical protein WEH80_26880 [Actinomycetes bacterium KLBMP 9759]